MVKRDVFSQEHIPTGKGPVKSGKRPVNVPRHDPLYIVKTVKHSDSVMVCGAFSGIHSRGGLYFLSRNVTMKGSNYFEMLNDHFLPFWGIHHPTHFMHDGAPAHRTKLVTKWLEERDIPVFRVAGELSRP